MALSIPDCEFHLARVLVVTPPCVHAARQTLVALKSFQIVSIFVSMLSFPTHRQMHVSPLLLSPLPSLTLCSHMAWPAPHVAPSVAPADFSIIKRPMDLGTIQHQLENYYYTHYTQVLKLAVCGLHSYCLTKQCSKVKIINSGLHYSIC